MVDYKHEWYNPVYPVGDNLHSNMVDYKLSREANKYN